ncbi:MAG: nuclear transport factor 2 family protein, partial [bacterium]|nr:nuclear transport factor 2 family protein [bacterium]
MRRALIVTAVALVIVSTPLPAQHRHDDSVEYQLEQLIVKSYLHGAFNELNPAAMEKGFHPDFAIFSAKGDKLGRYEIADWVEGVAKRKADPEFDAEKNKWDYKITN